MKPHFGKVLKHFLLFRPIWDLLENFEWVWSSVEQFWSALSHFEWFSNLTSCASNVLGSVAFAYRNSGAPIFVKRPPSLLLAFSPFGGRGKEGGGGALYKEGNSWIPISGSRAVQFSPRTGWCGLVWGGIFCERIS